MPSLIYQEFGPRCPDCGQADCVCVRTIALPPTEQTIRLTVERKGRGGKTVTILTGFVHTASQLQRLAQQLKAHCGAGGTAQEQTIEVQGEHRERLALFLNKLGYRVKRG
ncbi:translation initiation factor [Anthocerotibacter panamensis]|uniref:translation initiation factor n=1 Tax=Anthocerotibacter panamensis TaxID=2857077 RepID=UPI001C4073EE|nr:stress response translation initiation inhibitor YciH [Anthocerotibacter panamensis]